MFIRLEEFDKRLEGIYLIMGVGLTSNIYMIGKKEVTLIDSGNGARANSLTNQFQKMNREVVRNEGYIKSLKEDMALGFESDISKDRIMKARMRNTRRNVK